MKEILWKEEFKVGVSTLDRDHQKMFSAINQLYRKLSAGDSAVAISTILGELVAYTRTHFEAEEKCMEVAGYPDIKEHEEQHRELLIKVVGICGRASLSGDAVRDELCDLLDYWLSTHILEHDMGYANYFKENGLTL